MSIRWIGFSFQLKILRWSPWSGLYALLIPFGRSLEINLMRLAGYHGYALHTSTQACKAVSLLQGLHSVPTPHMSESRQSSQRKIRRSGLPEVDALICVCSLNRPNRSKHVMTDEGEDDAFSPIEHFHL
jgi:hypothetical protein